MPTTTSDGIKRDGDICVTCSQTRLWHENNVTRHTFNDGSVPFKATFGARTPHDARKTPEDGSQGAVRVPWPHDPVLRQALMDLGIITPQNLRDAEEKIRAVTAAFLEGGYDGQREVQERTST